MSTSLVPATGIAEKPVVAGPLLAICSKAKLPPVGPDSTPIFILVSEASWIFTAYAVAAAATVP